MSNRNSFTVTNDNVVVSTIVVMKGQVLEIIGDIVGCARVHDPIMITSVWSSREICLKLM